MHAFDMSIPVGHWVDTEAEASEWLKYFIKSSKTSGSLGIDTETTGLDILRDRVVVWSLSDGIQRICMPEKFLQMYKEPLLENPSVNYDGTRIKFDAHMIANMGVDLSKAGSWCDTIPQSWLKNENNIGGHGLKECILEYFNRVTPSFTETFGKVPPKKKDKLTGRVISRTVGDLIKEAFAGGQPHHTPEEYEMAELKKIQAADYASLDAYNSKVLRHHLDSILEKIPCKGSTLKDYYHAVESPYTKVLWKMERCGITVDGGYLKTRQVPMKKEMTDIEAAFANEATRLSGSPRMINLNSPKDVGYFFYGLLGKPVEKLTDGGASGVKNPSTDATVLDGWAGQGDPWAQKMGRHRVISKAYNTYVVGLQQWIDYQSKIHTTLNQTGAVTGRLSSTDPNLMNIPRPGEDEYKLREGFIPSDGYVLLVADYEQVEMRLMADASGDEKMINAINSGIDIHCLTVSEMNGIPYDEVMDAKKAEGLVKKGLLDKLTHRQEELLLYRQGAKATGFGIIYGIGGKLLAANLTKDTGRLHTEQDGNNLIDKWFGVFPGVRIYIEKQKGMIWQNGYITTILGRYRRFGDFKGMSRRDRGQAERQGVNAGVQGSAADITKLAMIEIDRDPILKAHGYRMLLQVHDEIVGECFDNPESIKICKQRKKELMEESLGFSLSVKIPASVGSGYDWATAK